MEKTFVLLDAGFLSKLSKHLGRGKYLKYDLIKFAKDLAKKENLFCEKIFYYTAPPFQSEPPKNEEIKRKEKYDSFVKKISKEKIMDVREGRCQRLKINGEFVFRQKSVDSLIIIDLMRIPIEHKEIKKIILIASDSDFVPAIEYMIKLNIEVILYTHYSKKRKSNLSRSNELLKVVSRYVEIKKEDFEKAELKKEFEK